MANIFLSLTNLTSIKNNMLDLLYRTTNIMIPLTYWKTSTTVVSGESTSLQSLILKLINVSISSGGSVSATENELYFIKRYLFGKTRVYNNNRTSFNVNSAIYYLGSISSESSPTESNVGSINIILYKYNANYPANFCTQLNIRVTVNVAQKRFIKYMSTTINPAVNITIPNTPYGTYYCDISTDTTPVMDNTQGNYTIDVADYVDNEYSDIVFFLERNFGEVQGGNIDIISVSTDKHLIFYINDTGGQESLTVTVNGTTPSKIYKLNGASTYDGINVCDGEFYKVELFGIERAIVTKLK